MVFCWFPFNTARVIGILKKTNPQEASDLLVSGHAEPGEAGGGGQQCGTEPLADGTLRERRKKGAGFLFECVAILKSGTGKRRCGLVSGLGCQKKRAGRETCYLFGAFLR